MKVENTLANDGSEMAVQLKFSSIEDFEPAKVVEQVEPLRKLLDTRNRLRELLSAVDRADGLESELEKFFKTMSNSKSSPAKWVFRPMDQGKMQPAAARRKEVPHEYWRTSTRRTGIGRRRSIRRELARSDHATNARAVEKPRRDELIRSLVEESLKGTVKFDKNITQTVNRAISAIDAAALKTARCHHAQSDIPKARRLVARLALSGYELRDERAAQAPGAQCL